MAYPRMNPSRAIKTIFVAIPMHATYRPDSIGLQDYESHYVRRIIGGKTYSKTKLSGCAGAAQSNGSRRDVLRCKRPNAAAPLRKHAANQGRTVARPETSYRLVLVEWEDSSRPISAWQWTDEYQVLETVNCVSVGYLIAETGGALAVAPNLGDIGRESSGKRDHPHSANLGTVDNRPVINCLSVFVARCGLQRKPQALEFVCWSACLGLPFQLRQDV